MRALLRLVNTVSQYEATIFQEQRALAARTHGSDVEATIIARLRDLPPERQQDVLDFIESVSDHDGDATGGGHSQEDEFLIARYIDTINVDHDHPSYARLAQYGVPVWAVVNAWKATRDGERVAREWAVPVDYVHAALAYYRRYGRYIDAIILLNEAPADESHARRT